MSEIARLHVAIGAKTEEFRKGMDGMQQQLRTAGKSMQAAGGMMTKYITLPLLAIGTAAFKMGKDFEVEMSKIVGLVGVASDQVDQWGRDILVMAPALAKAPKELAEALFFVTSAGMRGAEAMDVLEMSAKASAAGLGETKTVADLVTSAINAYGIENLSASEATDILVGAVREGKAEASELAATMGAVLPVASEMGITFDQVGAAQAAMTRTGTDAGTAATQLRAIMVGLLNPAKQVEEALADMGTSSAELREQIREKGLIAVLGDLRQMTADNNLEMTEIFPNVRALAGVLDLVGANAEENVDIFGRMADTTGLLDDAFATAADTAEFQWQQAIVSVKVAAIELWETLQRSVIPVMQDVSEQIQKATKWFRELEPEQRENIVKWGMIAAAMGPALIIAGKIAVAISALIPVFAALLGPIGLVILALGALVAAGIYVYRNWEEIKVQLIAAWEMIRGAAVSVSIGIQRAWYSMQERLYGITKAILDAVAPLIKWLPDSMTAGFDRMRAGVARNIGDIQGKLGDLSDAAEQNFERVRNAMSATSYTATQTSDIYGDQLDLMNRSTAQTAESIGYSVEDINFAIDSIPEAMGGAAEAVGGSGRGISDTMKKIAEDAEQMEEDLEAVADAIIASYKAINEEIELTRQIHQAEYALMREELAHVGDEMTELNIRAEELRGELEIQKDAVEAARTAFELMREEKGESARATKELYLEYLKAKTHLEGLKNAVDDTVQSKKDLNDARAKEREEQEKSIAALEAELFALTDTRTETEKLKDEKRDLTQAIDAQGQAVNRARAEMEILVSVHGEAADISRDAYRAYLEEAIALETLKGSLEDTTSALSDLNAEQAKAIRLAKEAAQAIATSSGWAGGVSTTMPEWGPDATPKEIADAINATTEARLAASYEDDLRYGYIDPDTTWDDYKEDRSGEFVDTSKYNLGGLVPGLLGKPRLAVVHGGEEVLTPAQRRQDGSTDITINAVYYVDSKQTAEYANDDLVKKLQGRGLAVSYR